MKKQLLMGLLVCLGVGFFISSLFILNDEQTPEKKNEVAVRVKPATMSGEPETPFQHQKNKMIAQEVAPTPKLFIERDLPEVSENVLNAVARFKNLDEKVFATEAEVAERASVLRNSEVLKEMQSLLMRAEPDEFERDLVAMDILVKSLETSPEFSRELVEAFVFDATVEKSQLSPEEQQYLAELKGELIYHWIAYEPERLEEIERQLPGPISKKLFQNAKEMRMANLLESSLEL
jgi:hypothetical protein